MRRHGSRRRARRLRSSVILAAALALAVTCAWAAPKLASQLADSRANDPAVAQAQAAALRAPALPDPGGPYAAGSAEAAQADITAIAETFADCVYRAATSGPAASGGAAQPGPADNAAATDAESSAATTDPAAPPYGACLRARHLGLTPGAVARRGDHGPIDGRGARNAVGVFTVHGEREAFLLKYDAAATGWGYAFDANGTVQAVCRTPKGRECWHAEEERPGALFLGDFRTEQVLGAVLRLGRSAR